MLKFKFIQAFFLAEATVASSSCCLFSWTCIFVHYMVRKNWQSDVQNLILWLEYMTSITYPHIFQKCHRTTLTLWFTGLLNCYIFYRRFVPTSRRITVC